MNARNETSVKHVGVQKGFGDDRFDLYNIEAPGWAMHGSTIMVRQGTPAPVALEAAIQKVIAGGRRAA